MAIDGPKVVLTCGSARFSLQTMPVEDYPSLPTMPEARGTVPSGLFANAVSQAVTAAGRDDMLPVLTGVRLEMEGDGDRDARDRPVPALPAASSPGRRGAADIDAAALVPAKVLADTAKSLTGGTEISIALASVRWPARASSASRAPPAAASVVRRPDCSTASSPRCARCSRSEHLTDGARRPGRPGRLGQARLAGRRAQHGRAADVQRRGADPRRRQRRGGDGSRVDRGVDHRRGHHHGLQPAVPARRPDRDRVAVRGTGLHTGLQARRNLGCGRPRRGRRHATSATC